MRGKAASENDWNEEVRGSVKIWLVILTQKKWFDVDILAEINLFRETVHQGNAELYENAK